MHILLNVFVIIFLIFKFVGRSNIYKIFNIYIFKIFDKYCFLSRKLDVKNITQVCEIKLYNKFDLALTALDAVPIVTSYLTQDMYKIITLFLLYCMARISQCEMAHYHYLLNYCCM